MEPAFISIPRGLPTSICRSTRTTKAITVFYQLKALYTGGVVLNMRRRYREVADTLAISESKLRSYVKYLQEDMDLVWWDGHHLTIRSSKVLTERWKVSKFRYKLPPDIYRDNAKLENVVYQLALAENQERQAYQYLQKLTRRQLGLEGKAKGERLSKAERTVFARVRRDFSKIVRSEQKRFVHALSTGYLSGDFNAKDHLNPFFSFTRQKIAEILGKKSKSTGSRRLKKLKSYDLVEKDEPLLIPIGTLSIQDKNILLNMMDSNKNTILSIKGQGYIKFSNQINLKDIRV